MQRKLNFPCEELSAAFVLFLLSSAAFPATPKSEGCGGYGRKAEEVINPRLFGKLLAISSLV
ncbi:MAG: hypothetical protein EGQ00_01935 [Parabacteroides johnsonii]|nr:hypothetical protein [Parabacteroides johnsonii]